MSYNLEHKNIAFGFDLTSRQPTQGLEKVFFIPSYQRGYRWTTEDVTKLLDDIWESAGRLYSLLPIVVKRGAVGTALSSGPYRAQNFAYAVRMTCSSGLVSHLSRFRICIEMCAVRQRRTTKGDRLRRAHYK